MLDEAAAQDRERVRFQFYRMTRAKPIGIYALVDYVNFKGEGINPTERYNGQGWGLLQVLQGMKDVAAGAASVESFAVSADGALTLRVSNAPPARHEERWLPGWRKRLKTYP